MQVGGVSMFSRETYEFLISVEHLKSLGIAIGVFLIFLLFRKIVTKYIFRLVMRSLKNTKVHFLTNIFKSFQKPMEWLFIIVGVYASIAVYPYFDHEVLWLTRLVKVAFIILLTWGLVDLSSTSSNLFRKINERTNINIDEILIPLLSRSLQFVVIAISITVILQEFGYNIEGFIAGLGLGGLAVSLAARDALANILGGIVIISEKPFNLGDWILTPSVEGIVEDISFRSTRIRTFADALVTVPNNTLANENITNWSKMGKRQISFTIRISYDTAQDKIKRALERINSLLKGHEDIHQETIFVNLEKYTEDGLEIMLYFFTKTTVWGEYLEVREEINLRILEILDEEGIEIALPARRLMVDDRAFGENDQEGARATE
jgi:MscS family membrane protein